MELVFDTNVVLSALLFPRSALSWLRQPWKSGELTPVVCSETAAELVKVLCYPKFKLSPIEQEALLSDFLPYARISRFDPVPASGLVCRDPKDQIFIDLAIAEQVSYLVSGDQDILDLASQSPVPFLTPAELQATLQGLAH